MPAEIADLADGLWQKALTLASQAAQHEDNAARERLEQLRLENEIRAQSFSLRQKELDAAARARERALTESQEHLRALLRVLERDRSTHAAREARIADLEAQLETHRLQLATIVRRAVSERRLKRTTTNTTADYTPWNRKAKPPRRAESQAVPLGKRKRTASVPARPVGRKAANARTSR